MARSSRNGGKKKRQRKKREHLRLTNAGSPYSRIGKAGGEIACYINDDWRDDGMASIHVLRAKPGGGHASAGFLVDLYCIGLKDAFGRLDIERSEFLDRIEPLRELGLERIDVETVRRLVAGGIRFSHENGFRLPPRYKRWTALLGDLGDVDQADVSAFGVDGKLLFVGNIDDLKSRLIGCTAEEFLSREDVDWITDVGPGLEDDDEFVASLPDEEDVEALEAEAEAGAVVEQAAATIREGVLEQARHFCFANGEAPSPKLGDAWDLFTEAMLQSETPPDEEDLEDSVKVAADELEDGEMTETWELVAEMLALETPEDAVEITRAIRQIGRFMKSIGSPDELADAIGLPPMPDDEETDKG